MGRDPGAVVMERFYEMTDVRRIVFLGVLFLFLIPSCRTGRELVREMKLTPYVRVWRSIELEKTKINRIAILPMTSLPVRKGGREGGDLLCSFCGNPVVEHHDFSKAGERISSYLSEALRKVAAYEIVPPGKVYATLTIEQVSPEGYDAAFLKGLGKRFGVDALVVGEILKIHEREGENYSVVTPATISFRLTMVRVEDGRELFKVFYDETQRSLNEEPQRLFHPSRIRFRWQTAEELARAAIQEIVKTFPGVQSAP